MPIYTFVCPQGHTEEVFILRSEDEAPATCSDCGERLDRTFSAPVIRYRAAGFYSTDYKPKPLPKGFGQKW